MRLRCRHDRAWPCPIGVLAAVPGTVIDLKLYIGHAEDEYRAVVASWQGLMKAQHKAWTRF
jgi:hypothetical protein